MRWVYVRIWVARPPSARSLRPPNGKVSNLIGETWDIAGIDVDLVADEARGAIDIAATVRTTGKTGVEMEALTAVSIAALTVYDMLKAAQKDMRIGDIRLVRKTGGKSWDYESG